ncbi:hypothetical protein IT401_00460 [Candidatus Nomurabacteria bacterium]|nr:hypothetical protein [Candidatus Nomurabacteria bacterium]
MKKFIVALMSSFALPALALAQDFGYVDTAVSKFQQYLLWAVSILMIAMTVWFLWSVFRFIAAKDPKVAEERKHQVINGLIGLFLAVAVWGIIRIAQRVTGTQNSGTQSIVCPPGYKPGGAGGFSLPGTGSTGGSVCVPI